MLTAVPKPRSSMPSPSGVGRTPAMISPLRGARSNLASADESTTESSRTRGLAPGSSVRPNSYPSATAPPIRQPSPTVPAGQSYGTTMSGKQVDIEGFENLMNNVPEIDPSTLLEESVQYMTTADEKPEATSRHATATVESAKFPADKVTTTSSPTKSTTATKVNSVAKAIPDRSCLRGSAAAAGAKSAKDDGASFAGDTDGASSYCTATTMSSVQFDHLTPYLMEISESLNLVDAYGEPLTSEDIFQTLMEGTNRAIRYMSPTAVVVMDRHCTVVDFNPRAEDIFGRSKEETIGRNIKVLMPPEVAVKHDDYIKSYLQRHEQRRRAPRSNIVGQKQGREVLAVRTVQGKLVTFPALITVSGIPHPGGPHIPPLFFVGYVEDVSQRRQLKEAMEINEFIREKGNSPLIVMNDYGKIMDFNNAASDMFRYSRKFIVGQNIKKLMPPATAAGHDEKLRQWRDRVHSNMTHASPVVGKIRILTGFRPAFENDGCEEFKLELRVEAFSGGRVLVAFLRDVSAESQNEFMSNTTADTFPPHTVDRLMRGESAWDRQDNVTILFSDVVEFSAKSADMDSEDVFSYVNTMVSAFDELGYGMEKIKTIGDGYMAYFTNADDAVLSAFRMQQWCQENGVAIRVGLHTGSVVSGVIGTRRRTFDMWGDAVNTAKRMEETGIGGQVQISQTTYDALMDDTLCKCFVERTVHVKSKGETDVFITSFPPNSLPNDVAQYIMTKESQKLMGEDHY